MAKDVAIVLSSGSINSVVATALAAQRYRLILLHAEVGEGGTRARAAYDQQVQHFKPFREHSLPMPFLATVQDPKSSAAFYQAAAVYLGFRVGGTGDELAAATEYTQIWNELIQMPCGVKELEVITPLLELDAWQVVDVGFQVNAPMEKTWSCLEE